MNIALRIIFQDERSRIEMVLSEYPTIISDGAYLLFTDDDDKDYRVHISDVFSIDAVNWTIYM
jgi:hypothetical protein